MNKITTVWIVLVCASMLMLAGCSEGKRETTTSGNVEILVDESLYPVLKQEEEKFESLYTDAKVSLKSMTSREAIVQLLNVDTTKAIVSFRPMNKEENVVRERSKIQIQEYKVALDAVTFIVHPTNPVDSLRTTQLDSIFRGVTKTWGELGWKNNSTAIATCVPNQNSGVFEVVVLKVLHGEQFGPVASIQDSADAMIRYVEEHQSAIGMISISNLRGKDQDVKMVALSDPNAPDSLEIENQYFTPHQAHMYRGYYPLSSEVYIYSRSDRHNVGTGFISFMTSSPGQKIFLYNGLVPETMPVRLVELTNREM